MLCQVRSREPRYATRPQSDRVARRRGRTMRRNMSWWAGKWSQWQDLNLRPLGFSAPNISRTPCPDLDLLKGEADVACGLGTPKTSWSAARSRTRRGPSTPAAFRTRLELSPSCRSPIYASPCRRP